MEKENKSKSETPETPETPKTLKTPKTPKEYKPGDTYEIPAEGSLGLLALGYRGLEAWRKAQAKAGKETTTIASISEKTNEPNQATE